MFVPGGRQVVRRCTELDLSYLWPVASCARLWRGRGIDFHAVRQPSKTHAATTVCTALQLMAGWAYVP